MTFMVWNEELETGIDIVDRQHHGLVDMLNQAAPILAQSSQETMHTVKPLLDTLLDYAATHFRTEEEMMARLGMDARAQEHHHASHAHFAQQVVEMVDAFSQGKGVTGDRLLSFLASWLVLHILGEDQAMARQFLALESGMPAAQAYETARGDELHPAPAALSHALVGIYTVLTQQNRELLLTNRDLDASRAEVQHHNETLEQTVRQRTAELEQLAEDLRAARDAAEAASRAKTRFLGTMSHELRTPMNAILGFSRLLHDQGLPAQQDVLAHKIVGASDRLLELLSGIIDYSRLEGGGSQDVRHASFDLAVMLTEACAAGCAAARAKGLRTEQHIDPALPATLRGDASLIQRILGLFISNAEKFTAHGMLQIMAKKVASESDDHVHLRFSVSDTGIGIPPEVQARLFQPFMQADDSPDRKFEGIGLGLALSRELAHLMGGEVGVESEPGKGSTFWLDLRLPEGDAVAASNPAASTSTKPAQPVQATPTASGPMPENLRSALRLMDKLLRAYDTRAGALLEQAAPRLRPWLGGQIETLAGLIAAFDYDQALTLLQTIQTEASVEKHHE
jgi:hemerythrin-like metal-binding protein